MKYIFFSILLFATRLSAQPLKISNDPSVDWAAVIELTLPADPLSLPEEQGRDATIAVLKLAADDHGLGSVIDHSLSSKLWEMAKSEQWEMYADPALTRRLPFEQVMRRFSQPDTTITFDPETYEEKVQIAFDGAPLPFEAPEVKVRQILSYHNRTATFNIQTIAIAPCWDHDKVAFWLKVPTTLMVMPESIVIQPDITWAVRYTTEDTSPSESNWEEVKNTTGDIVERFVDRIRNDTSVYLFDLEEDLVPPAKRACLFACNDTITVFDPQTWKEHTQVLQTGLDFEQQDDLQLIEEWYWQEEQGQLLTRLIAVAPRYWIYVDGQQDHRQAKFYRRCDD